MSNHKEQYTRREQVYRIAIENALIETYSPRAEDNYLTIRAICEIALEDTK